MAHYTFDIIKYTLITEKGETYKDFIEMKDLKLKTAESSKRHRNWQGP